MQRSEAAAAITSESAHNALTLLESSRVFGCIVVDDAGRIRWANALFRHWLESSASGAGELRKLTSWLPRAEDKDAVCRALAGRGVAQIGLQLERSGGAHFPILGDLIPLDSTGQRPAFAGFFHAADYDQKLKAGMERNARLEALGNLTSGVAHDFNNLLTILVGNLSLVAEELRSNPGQFGKLKSARDAAKRGGELIKQLLSFARQEPVPSELINPAKVISRIAPLVERALGSRIVFELELDERADLIQGNSAQLESVVVNLAVNARDAIEDQGCVTIRVATMAASGTDPKAGILGPSRQLLIEVADDGAGISPEIVDRVFDPFFTTKGKDQGSGLGLSMVRQYADQFGGTPEIISQPGVGTRVRLTFPCASGSINDSAAMTMPLAALPSGTENIIVLARDENLSAMINQILTVLGYAVRVAADLASATKLLKAASPALIICDGFEIDALIEGYSNTDSAIIRVLMLQAVGVDETETHHTALHKPFSIPDLAVTVRETLDAGQ